MSCKVEKMNYERVLISPVVRMNHNVYVNVFQQLSPYYMHLQGTVRELGKDGTGGHL